MPENTSKAGKSKNIQAAPPGSLIWNPADTKKSLLDFLTYVEGEAEKAIDWYWKNKRWKSRLSRFIQFGAIALTAAGGIAPVVAQMQRTTGSAPTFDSGL